MIVTNSCSISRKQYLTILLGSIARDWWSIALLIFLALVVAACFDLSFAIVLLLLLFVIAPMLLFMLYFNYALRPECVYSVMEKTLYIDVTEIACEIDERRYKVIEWGSVTRVMVTARAYLFYTGRYSFFYLPREAFSSARDHDAFVNIILPTVIPREKSARQ